MKINLSKFAGFCPGVRKADETVRRILAKQTSDARVFTLGHLIHNRIYNEELAALGASSISFDEVENRYSQNPDAPMTLVIRTQGIQVGEDLAKFILQTTWNEKEGRG